MRKPVIHKTGFGFIVADDDSYEHDIVIRLSGKIIKRRKQLSRAVYGTSHIISFDEAEHILEEGAVKLIIGAGHYGRVTLSDEAAKFFRSKNCEVELLPTWEAAEKWNMSDKGTIGLFHITC